jgi:biotin operon repressor
MTTSQRAILTQLQLQQPTGRGLSNYALAQSVNQPEPSMRRNVQALRAQGYDISVSRWNGYKLRTPSPVTPTGRSRF